MMKHFGIILLTGLLFTGCKQDGFNSLLKNNESLESTCLAGANPDNIHCKLVKSFSTFITDSFERENVFDSSLPAQQFGWRKIINDNGTIINGQAGNNVDMQIYGATEMGPASDGDNSLYSFGRQGSSVHNLYLISKTFNINELANGDSAIIEFDYLAINLEASEYLRLEVCNNTAENCGVGSSLTISGLNDPQMWQTVFEIGPSSAGENLNGQNHTVSDWQTAKAVMFLENFQRQEFIFRFNSRMNEGFINNNMSLGMEDGVAIDRVRATAYDLEDGVQDEVETPEDILTHTPNPNDF